MVKQGYTDSLEVMLQQGYSDSLEKGRTWVCKLPRKGVELGHSETFIITQSNLVNKEISSPKQSTIIPQSKI